MLCLYCEISYCVVYVFMINVYSYSYTHAEALCRHKHNEDVCGCIQKILCQKLLNQSLSFGADYIIYEV